MNKLILQLSLMENVPTEVINLAYLIKLKLDWDKVFNKVKTEHILANISELESVLKMNNIHNDVLNRELSKLKENMYKKLDWFKEQEKLREGI